MQPEFRVARADAIQKLHDRLKTVPAGGLPFVLASVMTLPVMLFFICTHTLAMAWVLLKIWMGCLFRFIVAPFTTLYLLFDLFGITWWFLSKTAERMSEKKP